tara:strand:- start:1945 stop:2361 length:417 start_codon:yes stop_codon:yes gene_type:complete
MDKTTRLAKPRSINKGGQRRDIYYNEDGELYGDNKTSERNFNSKNEKVNDSDRAKLETLRYYFDDEWFDDRHYIQIYNSMKTQGKNLRNSGAAYPPTRCTECHKPFQIAVGTGGKTVYIDEELFTRMPLVEGVCDGCS